jgi:hypothetical protein
MNFKVVAPPPISRAIGGFQLERNVMVRLLAAIHSDIPAEYEQSHLSRTPGHEETYDYRVVLRDNEWDPRFSNYH